MRTRLTVTVDKNVLRRARRYARRRGVSLSSLVEAALYEMTGVEEATSFVDRWRGAFTTGDRPADDRSRALADKYGLTPPRT